MSNDRPIIIKKVKKVVAGGHHGGAWKVAYADFVTAMMAFFLLMWLLNAVSEETREGLADFFNDRIPIVETSGGGQSMLHGETIVSTELLLSQGAAIQMAPGGAQSTKEPVEETELDTPAEFIETTDGESEEIETADADKTLAERLAETERELDELDEAFERIKEALASEENAFADEANDLLKHITLKMTPLGLVIEIADRDGDSLFQTASAAPAEKLGKIIEMITPIVASVKNRVAITGHTDAVPYSANAAYTNWELSSDRANAARRLMLGAGFPPAHLRKVIGASSTDPIDQDPTAAVNRRIAITLLRGDKIDS